MTHRGKRKRTTARLAAAFILACYLVQTADCLRLRKTERREGRQEADMTKTPAFREGKIVFGRPVEERSGPQSQVQGSTKVSSNASAADVAAYQADSPGWSKAQDASSKEASWQRMAHSLQCGAEQMKLRVVGHGASNFAVDQGSGSSLPLSQVPSTCGYTMQRNSLALIMYVPYDGCSVVQEGGSYTLPLLWQGVPVMLWCPKPAQPPATTAAPQNTTPETPKYSPTYLQMPINFPPYQIAKFPPIPYFQYPPVMTTKKPQMPQIPQYPYFPNFYPYFPPLPATTAATTTTTTTTAAATTKVTTPAQPPATAPPPVFPYPFPFPVFPPFPWPLPGPLPTTPVPKTTTTTAKPANPQMPQVPPFFPIFPPYQFPAFPPYLAYPTSKPTTTTATTTEKTEPATTVQQQHPPIKFPFPVFPVPHYHPIAG